jgi:hypothetical protein
MSPALCPTDTGSICTQLLWDIAAAFLGQYCKEWLIAWEGVFAKGIPAPNILTKPYRV